MSWLQKETTTSSGASKICVEIDKDKHQNRNLINLHDSYD